MAIDINLVDKTGGAGGIEVDNSNMTTTKELSLAIQINTKMLEKMTQEYMRLFSKNDTPQVVNNNPPTKEDVLDNNLLSKLLLSINSLETTTRGLIDKYNSIASPDKSNNTLANVALPKAPEIVTNIDIFSPQELSELKDDLFKKIDSLLDNRTNHLSKLTSEKYIAATGFRADPKPLENKVEAIRKSKDTEDLVSLFKLILQGVGSTDKDTTPLLNDIRTSKPSYRRHKSKW